MIYMDSKMKLRLIQKDDSMFLYCSNGSILKITQQVLVKFLTQFRKPSLFKGEDGFWNNGFSDMQQAPGKTIAYVDSSKKLIILDEIIFDNLLVLHEQPKYLSVSEYAEKHFRCRASVKNMCVAGRIPGAYKASSGWMIPYNAPYPERKSRTSLNKE